MRELYGELLFEAGRSAEAFAAFETSLRRTPNRLNGFIGAAGAARALGRNEDARGFYASAAALTADAVPGRRSIAEARRFARP